VKEIGLLENKISSAELLMDGIGEKEMEYADLLEELDDYALY
jgi:hypothetical protein